MTEQESLEGVEVYGARCGRLCSLEITLGRPLSRRKLRLYSTACARRIWQHFDPQTRNTIEVIERFADGRARRAEFRSASKRAQRVAHKQGKERGRLPPGGDDWPTYCARSLASWASDSAISGHVAECAADWAVSAAVDHSLHARDYVAFWKAVEQELETNANLSRELVGNPFRPVTLEPACRAPTVLALAQGAYDKRILPAGHLDPDRLAVLADALEDAGCTDAVILGHLRGPGPHVRGCWAVDLILGKQ